MRAGSFCIAVLKTDAPPRAAAFYHDLLTWTTDTPPADHGFFLHDGKVVAAFQRRATGPEVWLPHVLVDDTGTSAAAATALGGALVERAAMPGVARTATLVDVEGAAFGVWQPDPHSGAEAFDRLGSIWWIELLCREPRTAGEFYRNLFGWSARETAFEPIDSYTVFERGTVQEGGAQQIHPEWNLTPRWNTIVSVEDCDRMLARACDLGGESGFVHTVPKHGRIGAFQDSGGADLILRGPVAPATA